jgi:hypothetical protein
VTAAGPATPAVVASTSSGRRASVCSLDTIRSAHAPLRTGDGLHR